MPINSVALANTFNEFRTTVNEVITTVNGVSGGSGVINANTLIGGTVTANNLTSGRVTLATTSGQLTDDSALTYDTATDILTLAGTTDASSSTTGTLKVAGGVGVAKKLYVGTDLAVTANTTLSGATDASSSTTGAVIITGGVGIAKKLYVGTDLAVSGNATITGDLTVNGTTTTVNSTTLTVDDKNIELGSVATPTDVTADGGGITLKGATDKSITWSSIGWTSSEDFNLVTGKTFEINGTSVLSATTLGSGVTGSSLTSVGTIGTGVWQGTLIDPTYGGTGVNNGAKTVTLGGNLVTSGAFNTTLTATANTTVTLPTSGTLVGSADTGTVTSTMIADGTIVDGDINASAAIAVSKLASSAVTVGNTAITLGTSSTTLAGLTSVTSTSFVGALTGNASTVTTNANLTGGVTSVGNAATVVTNANLTGDVTSVGNATTLTNAPVIAKVLTGYVSGAGTVAATDSILQAIQKLDGNQATNANLTGAVTSVGNATSLGSFTSAQLLGALTDETGTGAAVFATSPTLVTPALGTPSALVGTNITGTATSFTASNVTTNANLTGHITSVGNAAVLGSFTSLQLLTALTDETGTGANVFANTPTLVAPLLGTPTSGNLANCTFPTLNQNTTGNASTATTLQTARAINGVSFDGSAAITVTAAAGTLSGATLSSGVTASSLTSVGTISSGVWNGSSISTTYTDAKVTSIVAGTNISLSGATGAVTVNVSGTVANATTATNQSGGTVNATTGTFSSTISASNLSGTNTGDQTNISGNAATATTAGTVTTAAQPSITSVGTLTGLTVSATISGSINGNSATVGNFTPSATAGVANRVVVADSNGYIYNNWFNSTDGSTASGVTAVMVKQGDNWLRSGTAAAIATFISGQTMNINGSATSATSATTAGTVTTAAQPSITSVGTLTSVTTSGPIYRTAAGAGYLNGQYSSAEGSTTSGAIYSIGGAYVPGTTTLGNMYGVGYSYSSVVAGTTGAPGNLWGFYGASGGTSRFFLDSDNGRGYFASDLYVNNGSLVLSAGNYNSYAPTLTGTGASGTWGISVTGNSATVGGFTPSASSGVGNRVVVADASGYIVNSYFYTGGGGSERSASGMGYFAGFNSSDYYIRSYTPAAVATAISGQSMNINGTATGLSATLAVASGGTGTTTLASNNVLLGNGTSAVQVVAPSTSGNVLTSNGTTWQSVAPSPSSGSITATASGSISAGALVQMNSNGTVQVPTTSVNPSSVSLASAATLSTNGDKIALVYVPAVDRYVVFFSKAGTNALTARLGTPASDGTITFATDVTINANAGSGSVFAVLCKDAVGEGSTLIACGQALGGGAGAYIQPITVTASTITIGSTTSTARVDGTASIAWDRVNQRGSFVGNEGGTGYGFAGGWTISASTFTYGGHLLASDVYGAESGLVVDESNGYHMWGMRSLSNTFTIKPFTVSASRVITYSTAVSIYPYNASHHSGIYVPGPNKVLFCTSNGASGLQVLFITMTGSTPSVASSTSLGTTTSNDNMLGLDTNNGVVSVIHRRVSTGMIAAASFSINGTTVSFGSTVDIGNSNAVISNRGIATFDASRTRIAAHSQSSGSTGNVFTFVSASSTMTSSNYIGVSTASYVNGNTATIKTSGGLATGMTGVTPGAINYAAGTALTVTNTGIPVGRGVTSTSMIVSHS